jgi:hypothetical protein
MQVAVSFAHIVKSAEPVFSVMLSGPILGVTYPWYVWASLVPIVAGCSLSAMKEVSFSWGGFNNAMISNLGMVLRNIYSKKSLNDYKVGKQRAGHEDCGNSTWVGSLAGHGLDEQHLSSMPWHRQNRCSKLHDVAWYLHKPPCLHHGKPTQLGSCGCFE